MQELPKSLNSITKLVKQSLGSHFAKVCTQYDNVKVPDVKLQPSTIKECDYQSPSMMQLFNQNKKILSKEFKNVDELTKKVVSEFQPDDYIAKIDIGERSFLNITLQNSLLESEITNLLRIGTVHPKPEKPQIISIDFSSPNIAKELHVGNIRTTILGESMARILEYVGHKVNRINHIGDWGTQFGMLICYLQDNYPDFLSSIPDLKDLTKFYKQAKIKFDADEDFKKRSQLTVVKLQGGDKECLKAWEVMCEISRQFYNKIYQRLDIKVEEYGESKYNPMLPGIVKELEEKNMIEQEKNGAKVVRLPKFNIPVIVQKGDGGYNYSTTDLAAIKYRLLNLNSDRIIYVVDKGQSQHFQMVFKTAELIGWKDPKSYTVEHQWFGVIQGEDGKRFKARSGEAIKLVELLDEAKERALVQIKERAQQNNLTKEEKQNTGTQIEEKDQEKAAEAIGIAAIKYFDLRQNKQSDYKFSFDRMLDTKGNTAVYLLYSFARINSIIRKSGWSEDEIEKKKKQAAWKITHEHERVIATHLVKFTDIVESLQVHLNTNLLTDYIYEVTCKFSEGYKLYRILGEQETETRLLLCIALKDVLYQAFYLLGIKPLEKI